MAWRTGAEVFSELWPLLQDKVKPAAVRKDFLRDVLAVFLHYDMDPHDVEDLHLEVAEALRRLEEKPAKKPRS